jgi:hypothetical protein
MKKRYTEEQIIGFLRDGETGIGLLAESVLENEVAREALRKKW